MRAGAIQHASIERLPKPLAVRAGLARTFGGLAGFVAVTFLCGGSTFSKMPSRILSTPERRQ